MTAVIQIKDVPEELHRRIRARAEDESVSVSQLILREVRKSLERPGLEPERPGLEPERPTLKEVLDRIAAQPEMRFARPAADLIREDRESR